MARISSYGQDSTVDRNDKVLGTDSATGATKNYTVDSLLGLVNEENLVDVFDGAAFEFKDYVDPANDPEGVINLNAGVASNANFSAINVLYISVKDRSGASLAEYLENADNDFIKINKSDNLNTFGIYEVTAIEDYGSAKYKKLTLTPRGTNGQLEVGSKYFVANHSALYDQDFSARLITEFSDVTDAGSGQIITTGERASLTGLTANALVHSDVINNVTSTATDVPLSAAQGKVLKDLIDAINTLLLSDNVDLDTLQEVVNFIEANKSSLDSLGISNISGLQTALDNKQDAEVGKGLSAEDFTTVLKTKLEGITALAEPNVQSDWNEANSAADDFILNKPTDLTVLSNHSVEDLSDVTSVGSGAIITGEERTKLSGVAAGAEVNVQADWNATTGDALILNKPALAPSDAEQNVQADWTEANTSSDAFIQNKPSVVETSRTIQVSGTLNEVEVSPTTAQDLSANRTFTVGLPNDVTIGNDLTVSNDLSVGNNLSVDETIEIVNAQSTTPTFDNGIYYTTEDGHDTLHFRYHGHDLSIDYLTEVLPTGILNGGELSKTNNTQFTIAAGDGIINDLNKSSGSDPHPEIVKVEWTQQTITVSNLDSNNTAQLNSWIYVDSTGAVQQQAGAFTDAQKRSNIIIGSAIHSEGVLKFVKTFPLTAYNSASQLTEFANIFGALKKSGHKVTANGANLSIDRSAGVAFALGRNYASDPENPSTVSDSAQAVATIHRYYRDGSDGFVLDDGVAGAGYTVLDPSKYDDGTGTLATVAGGQFSVQRLYYFPGTPSIIVSYYGHDEYNSLDTAEKNYSFEDFSEFENTAQQAIYLGAIIMSGGATDLSDSAQAKILTAGSFRGLASVSLGGVAADASLGDLQDVTVSGAANNQLLKYNSSSTKWENSLLNVNDIGDVNITSLADNQILKYDSATSKWVNEADVDTNTQLSDAEVVAALVDKDVDLGIGQFSAGVITGGAFNVTNYMYHTADTDTYIRFTDDKIRMNAGGVQMMTLTEDSADTIVFNEDGADVDFRVESNSNTHMLFVDGGNDRVGIGTTSPSEKLDVDGNIVADNIKIASSILHEGDTDTNISFTNNQISTNVGGGKSLKFGNNSVWLEESDSSNFAALIEGVSYGARFNMFGDGVNTIRLSGDGDNFINSGNVGIGTDSPGVNFQVGDGTTDTASRFYFGDNTYTEVTGYGLQMSRNTSYIRPTADNSKYLYIGMDSKQWSTISFDATNTLFNTNGVENARIDSSGNLGIGTDSPSSKLDVNGTIAFNSLKDSGEDITITKFVDEADTIASNNNDTTIPTSAAVIDYVDTEVAKAKTETATTSSTDRANNYKIMGLAMDYLSRVHDDGGAVEGMENVMKNTEELILA